MERIWLDVPYSQKDEAKEAGARWSPGAKRWFAPRPGIAALARWEALPDVPDLLPGEDRLLGSELFVDLVPSSCWFTNVRTCVSEKDWERLRRMITRRAEMRCESCGSGEDRATRRWLEAHERWAFDSTTGTQRLARLICLCTDCHHATHYGRAQVVGTADAAFIHLRAVTGMSETQTHAHISEAFRVWEERSNRSWTLDLTMLTDAGVTVRKPLKAEERSAAAQAALAEENDGMRAREAERAKALGIQQRAAAHVLKANSVPRREPVPRRR
ncbi:DUF5710 domain-containing protein [Promicromonospora vindobonensis]|uniref:DUF5710 domain-containing protein n=1 Tax=Promicromonospora vindobonensis TaxID=195748 RepID=A0ABW5VY58_9MICO